MASITSEQSGGRFDAETFAQPVIDGSLSPTSVVAGDNLVVRGDVENPSSVYQAYVRATVESSSLGAEETIDFGRISTGQSSSFSANLGVVPDDFGQVDVEVTVEARPFSFGSWSRTDSVSGDIDVNTESEQSVQEAFDYLPYLIGGGGVGYVASNATNRDPRRGMIAGAAAGALAREFGGAPDLSGDDSVFDQFVPSFPTFEVAIIGGALLGAGYFLSQTNRTVGNIPLPSLPSGSDRPALPVESNPIG